MMFEKMKKHKKTWDEFCDWIYFTYHFNYNESGEFDYYGHFIKPPIILNLMPDFMADNDIRICIDFFKIFINKKSIYKGAYNIEFSDNVENDYESDLFEVKKRIEVTIKACEKAFEISEDNYKNHS